jgi:hypothetical protein
MGKVVSLQPRSQDPASLSIQQRISQAERLWNGLCVECCLALSWPLSLENLGAVKVSLLSTCALQLRAALNGGRTEQLKAEWSTFAQKALADLRRDSGRMLMNTEWSWLNCLQSSLTRRIYSNRRMRQRSLKRSKITTLLYRLFLPLLIRVKSHD